MNAVRMMLGVVGLNKALSLCGVSKKAWYYTSKPRVVPPDLEVLEMVQKISLKDPRTAGVVVSMADGLI